MPVQFFFLLACRAESQPQVPLHMTSTKWEFKLRCVLQFDTLEPKQYGFQFADESLKFFLNEYIGNQLLYQ